MNTYDKPLPRITDQSRRFWESARSGVIELPRCDSCGAFHTYFEPWCNVCGHEGVHWDPVSPQGRIWANCRFHKTYFAGFDEDVPYNVAIVELDDGPRLVTNIIDLESGSLSEMPIGMRVEAVFEAVTDEVTLIKFRPASTMGRER